MTGWPYFKLSTLNFPLLSTLNSKLFPNHRLYHLHIPLRPHFAGEVVHHELAAVTAHLLAELAVVVEGEDSQLKGFLVTCLGEDATC